MESEMKSGGGSRRKRVLSRVRSVARKAQKRMRVAQPLPPPPSELRFTPENPQVLALQTEYARLKEELQHQEVLTQDHPATGNHMADDASEVFEQTKNLALQRHLEEMLRQVEHAMQRIERGTYGQCEKCNARIDPERLQALPYATLCLPCAKSAHPA